MRIAMWSGPRNLSTAMMYSFGNRADFTAMDEPFYAPYLKATGADHPMKDEIIAGHECDPLSVAARCSSLMMVTVMMVEITGDPSKVWIPPCGHLRWSGGIDWAGFRCPILAICAFPACIK